MGTDPKSFKDWLRDLGDPNPEVRREAVWGLGDPGCGPLSGEARGALVGATTDEDPGVRSSALYLLARGGLDEAAVQTLILQGLRDTQPEVRGTALGCIGALESVRDAGWVVPALIERLEDVNAEVGEVALYTLGILHCGAFTCAFGPLNRSLREWAAEATAGDRPHRAIAALALASCGAEALGPLKRFLGHSDPVIRRVALVALSCIGPDALPAVQAALNDADPRVRSDACRALRRMGAAAVPTLAQLLHYPEGTIRWVAADSLSAVGPDAQAAVPDLIEVLRGTDESTGIKAALALAAVGAGHQAVVPALIEALGDPRPKIQDAAAYALSSLGSGAVAAISPLLQLSCTRDPESGSMPAHDLEKLLSTAAGTAPSEVAASLAEVLRNENADVRRTAIGYLADPVLRDHVPMDLLAEACHDPDPYVCYEATMSLGELGAKAARAASTLADLMESGDGRLGVLNTRQAAAFALGRIGPGAAVAVPALLRVLKDPDPQLRIAAAWTLSLIDPTISDSLPVLIENLSSVREPDRRNAADAMGRLGPLASEAILALEKALGDEVPAVRRSAERALQLINREQPNDRHADMSG